jgi:hypothetical protein
MKLFSKTSLKSLIAAASTAAIMATPTAQAADGCITFCAGVGAGVYTIVYTAVMASAATSCKAAQDAAIKAQSAIDPSKVGEVAGKVITDCYAAASANARASADIEGQKAYDGCFSNCTSYFSAAPVVQARREHELA